MKEWIKYLIAIILFVIFLNFWLIYQDFDSTIRIGILVAGPTIISLIFVYRMVEITLKWLKIIITLGIVAIVTSINIGFVDIIDKLIDHVTTDIETGLFLFLVLYLTEMLLLTWLANQLNKNNTFANNG